MRQTRTRLGHATAGLSALALLGTILGTLPARAEGVSAGKACVERYHASLGRIAAGEYQAVKTARQAETTADAGLPGMLLFPPTSAGPRTKAETAALRVAASLARAKGRAGGSSDPDARWMAERLRLSLSDYLTQSPSPYLCGGVTEYVATLRGFATRLGATPMQRETLLATQRSVAERAFASAMEAMKPVPLPSPPQADSAPTDVPATDRPKSDPLQDLRPAAGIDRVDSSIATGSTKPVTPVADPDLPQLSPEKTPALDGAADLVAAVDRLTAAAADGGFLASTPSPPPTGAVPALDPSAHPVLARLLAARPNVTGARPLVADRVVRLRLATAFSALEALDYLMRATTAGADPLATAIDGTFEAILKAHAADCTCSD